jgi:hypothetical protein
VCSLGLLLLFERHILTASSARDYSGEKGHIDVVLDRMNIGCFALHGFKRGWHKRTLAPVGGGAKENNITRTGYPLPTYCISHSCNESLCHGAEVQAGRIPGRSFFAKKESFCFFVEKNR